MTNTPQRESAKIYPFPQRRRAPIADTHGKAAASDVVAVRFSKAVFGSGWYHDAAVQDAQNPRKR